MKKLYQIKNIGRAAALKLVAAGLMMTSFGAFEAFAESHLIIHFNDGKTTSFVVAAKPRVNFGETQLHVQAEEMEAHYDIASVKKFVFGDASAIADSQLDQNECRFTFVDRNTVKAQGLKAGENIGVHATDGKTIMSVAADANGEATIDLTSLPAGVYLVSSTSSKTIKIKH